MSCEEFCGKIEEYLDGALAPEEKASFEEHMSSCPDCRDEVEFARACARAVAELDDIEVPADFLDNVHARIEKENAKSYGRLAYIRRFGAMAACLLIAVAAYSGFNAAQFEKSGSEMLAEERVKTAVVPNLQQESAGTGNTGETEAAPTKEENKAENKEQKAVGKKAVKAKSVKSAPPQTTPQPQAEAAADLAADTEVISEKAEDAAVADALPETDKESESIPMALSVQDEILPKVSSGGGLARAAAEKVVIHIRETDSEKAFALADEMFADGYFANEEEFSELLAKLDDAGVIYSVSGEFKTEKSEFVISAS